jgi:hypothetical protein
MLLSEGGSLVVVSADFSAAVGFSAAKAENGTVPRQRITAKIIASVLFKVLCITSSFLRYQDIVCS